MVILRVEFDSGHYFLIPRFLTFSCGPRGGGVPVGTADASEDWLYIYSKHLFLCDLGRVLPDICERYSILMRDRKNLFDGPL